MVGMLGANGKKAGGWVEAGGAGRKVVLCEQNPGGEQPSFRGATHPRAIADGSRQVQAAAAAWAAAGALLGQPQQVLQAVPLEAPTLEQHLRGRMVVAVVRVVSI